jgi:hypothetical protein
MGKFAEIAIVDYRLLFLTKENKLPFAANRWKFAVSVFR